MQRKNTPSTAAIPEGGLGFSFNLVNHKDLGHFRFWEHFLFRCFALLF
jgi:hypothetical protein